MVVQLTYCMLSSVFFYVGPDEDVFSLNQLTSEETRIIYEFKQCALHKCKE